jgi:hypothetical protein
MHANDLDSTARRAESKAQYRLEKIRRSFCDPPRWRLVSDDARIPLTTSQLASCNALWKKVFCATHSAPPFSTADEHRALLEAWLAECDEVAS